MIDWAGIETAIETWFETSTGISADWKNDSRPVRFKPRGFLRILSSRRLGGTQLIYVEDTGAPAGSEMVPLAVAQHQFTLSVQVVSRSQKPSEDARFFLEKARTNLTSPTNKKILQDANLSISRSEALINMDTVFDNRVESRANMDIIFNTTECESFTSEPTGFVDKVEISSDTNAQDAVDFNEEIFGNQS